MALNAKQLFVEKFLLGGLARNYQSNFERRKGKANTELSRLGDCDYKRALSDRLRAAENDANKKDAYHVLNEIKLNARYRGPIEARLEDFERSAAQHNELNRKLAQLRRQIGNQFKLFFASGQPGAFARAKMQEAVDAYVADWQEVTDALMDVELAARPDATCSELLSGIANIEAQPSQAGACQALRERAMKAKAAFTPSALDMSTALIEEKKKLARLLRPADPDGEFNALSEELRSAIDKLPPGSKRQRFGTALERLRIQAADETAAATRGALELKGQIEAYENEFSASPIGGGNFGSVYRMEHADGTKVVLKALKDGSADGLRTEQEFYDKVGEHPNIARCHGITRIGKMEGLVIEYVDGNNCTQVMDDLRRRFERGEIKSEEYWGVVKHTLAQMLSAAAHLADKGVAHNDLRFDNVMVEAATGNVKVVDFGIATDMGHQPRNIPTRWASPELLSGEGPGEGSDAYMVGGSAYLVGEQALFKFGLPPAQMNSNSLVEKKGAEYRQGKDSAIHVAQGRSVAESSSAQLGGQPPGPQLSAEQRFEKRYAAVRAMLQTATFPVDPSGLSGGSATLDALRALLDQARKCNAQEGLGILAEIEARLRGAQRPPGEHAARTAYTKFVNELMHPDPKQRLSPKQALDHPFLGDRLLDEEQVRTLIRGQMARSASSTGAPPAEVPGESVLDDHAYGTGAADLEQRGDAPPLAQAVSRLEGEMAALREAMPETAEARASLMKEMQGLAATAASLQAKLDQLDAQRTGLEAIAATRHELDEIMQSARARHDALLALLQLAFRDSRVRRLRDAIPQFEDEARALRDAMPKKATKRQVALIDIKTLVQDFDALKAGATKPGTMADPSAQTPQETAAVREKLSKIADLAWQKQIKLRKLLAEALGDRNQRRQMRDELFALATEMRRLNVVDPELQALVNAAATLTKPGGDIAEAARVIQEIRHRLKEKGLAATSRTDSGHSPANPVRDGEKIEIWYQNLDRADSDGPDAAPPSDLPPDCMNLPANSVPTGGKPVASSDRDGKAPGDADLVYFDQRSMEASNQAKRKPGHPRVADYLAQVEEQYGRKVQTISGSGMNCYIRALVTGVMRSGWKPKDGIDRYVATIDAMLKREGVRSADRLIDAGGPDGKKVREIIGELSGLDVGLHVVTWDGTNGRVTDYPVTDGAVTVTLVYSPGHFDLLL